MRIGYFSSNVLHYVPCWRAGRDGNYGNGEGANCDSFIYTAEIRHLGIDFVEAHWELAHEAGRFKVKNRMSFADCFAAALAKHKTATLLTGDQEFKQVEREITIHWLTNK